jgi:hypothetical protein
MGVGKSSLPATAAPVKKPVPKNAAIEAVSRIKPGERAKANAGTETAAHAR